VRVDDAAIGRRNDAISRLGVRERSGDPALTAQTRVAAFVMGSRAAAVHVIDDVVQRRIAATNAPLGESPREDSMCRLVVDAEQRIVCADATRDARFSYSSFVQGDAPVRFYASVPLTTSEGITVGSLCTFDTVEIEVSDEQIARLEDLAEQVVSQLELRQIARRLGHVASHDPLTGAVNRLVLTDRLSQAFARRMRTGGEIFVALADVDRFKAINDEMGHAAGDQVLVEVVARLRSALRAHDTVARVGGDEFVVVAELPDNCAEKISQRLHDALHRPMACGDRDRAVGVSLGCVLAREGEDIRDLLHRADAAMYEEKAVRTVAA
jgi:diguanylate cyclase (GGDEF)-like protein